MMDGVEAVTAEEWVIDLLTNAGVTGGRVFSRLAPTGTTEPYTIVQVQSQGSGLLYAIGAEPVWTDPLIAVRVVASSKLTGSWGELVPAVKAAHAALQDQTGTMPDGTILSCIREGTIDVVVPPTTAGRVVRQLGNTYRILVQ